MQIGCFFLYFCATLLCKSWGLKKKSGRRKWVASGCGGKKERAFVRRQSVEGHCQSEKKRGGKCREMRLHHGNKSVVHSESIDHGHQSELADSLMERRAAAQQRPSFNLDSDFCWKQIIRWASTSSLSLYLWLLLLLPVAIDFPCRLSFLYRLLDDLSVGCENHYGRSGSIDWRPTFSVGRRSGLSSYAVALTSERRRRPTTGPMVSLSLSLNPELFRCCWIIHVCCNWATLGCWLASWQATCS